MQNRQSPWWFTKIFSSSSNNGKISSENSDNQKKHKIQILVKDTKPAEGQCGHVTVVMEKENGETSHLSYNPNSGIGGVVTALGLPVTPVNYPHLHEDLKEADYVFETTVTSEEFDKAFNKKSRIETKMKKGDASYSFAGDNSWSQFWFSAFQAPKNFRETMENYKKDKGFGLDPTDGDMFGSVDVTEDQHAPKSQSHKFFNCVSASNKIVEAAGIPIEVGNLTTPAEYADKLRNSGKFNEVEPLKQSFKRS